MEDENTQSIEQKEKETENIKKAGNQIANASIKRRENEFVQQSVEEVLQNIEQVKKSQELELKVAQAQETKKQQEQEAKKRVPSDETNVGLSENEKYFFDGFTNFN